MSRAVELCDTLVEAMLGAYRTMSSLSLTAAALLALSTAGCGDAQFSIPIPSQTMTASTFSFVTNTKFPGGTDAVGTEELLAMTLTLQTSDTVTDLSFLSALEAQVVTATATTTVATLDSFPHGEHSASMHIDYLGQLAPLFDGSDTIQMAWTATPDPAFTTWPAGGIGVGLEVVVGSR